jgi:hypothetical protein
VGDQVYLKLQSYVQSSVTNRANQKLPFMLFGSYTIFQRVGTVAYKLKLSDSSLIHPVFHVPQLKLAIGGRHVVIPSLPVTNEPLQVPIQVIGRKMIQCGGAMVAQVKVTWFGVDAALATWEDAEALRSRFPQAPTWGQATSKDEGMSATHTRKRHKELKRWPRRQQQMKTIVCMCGMGTCARMGRVISIGSGLAKSVEAEFVSYSYACTLSHHNLRDKAGCISCVRQTKTTYIITNCIEINVTNIIK